MSGALCTIDIFSRVKWDSSDHLEEADDLLLELADHLEVRVNLAEQEADDVREVARRRPDRKVKSKMSQQMVRAAIIYSGYSRGAFSRHDKAYDLLHYRRILSRTC